MAAGDPSAIRASGLRTGRLALVVFGLGVMLGGLALPQLMAALAGTGGDAAIRAIGANRPVPPARLAGALRDRSQAARWWPAHKTLGDMALLLEVQARALDPNRHGAQRRLLLDRAVEAVRAALRRDAADPYLWMRLAQGLFLRDGLSPAATAAVVQSMRIGPTAQPLLLPRLELAYLLDSRLQPDQRQVVDDQIRLAAGWKPTWLVAFTRRRHALGIARRALAADPVLLQRFDLAWERSR